MGSHVKPDAAADVAPDAQAASPSPAAEHGEAADSVESVDLATTQLWDPAHPSRLLQGQWYPGLHVFITGGSSGIGAALARAYAPRCRVISLVGRREAALAQVRDELMALNAELAVRLYPVDVRDVQALAAAGQRAIELDGCPEVVIASAGISVGVDTARAADIAMFDKVVRTNLTAMAATFQPFITPMQRRKSGRLVGLASVAAVRGLPGHGAYSASKAGVVKYCESLRVELAPAGVKVVTIVPGYIRTPMTARNPFPMPFLMRADDFAQAAIRVIDRGARYRVIPWQMAVASRLLAMLPRLVYDLLFRKAPRKPREGG